MHEVVKVMIDGEVSHDYADLISVDQDGGSVVYLHSSGLTVYVRQEQIAARDHGQR
jgi:exoribonuclease R